MRTETTFLPRGLSGSTFKPLFLVKSISLILHLTSKLIMTSSFPVNFTDFKVDFKPDSSSLKEILQERDVSNTPARDNSTFGPIKRMTYSGVSRTKPYNKVSADQVGNISHFIGVPWIFQASHNIKCAVAAIQFFSQRLKLLNRNFLAEILMPPNPKQFIKGKSLHKWHTRFWAFTKSFKFL